MAITMRVDETIPRARHDPKAWEQLYQSITPRRSELVCNAVRRVCSDSNLHLAQGVPHSSQIRQLHFRIFSRDYQALRAPAISGQRDFPGHKRRARETVPDWVVDEADEVRFIDLTPRALRNRLERGVIYGTEKAHQAMEHFFTETNLAALREIALRHAAHEVEEKLDDAPVEALPQGRPERILICVTGNPSSASLIRRGKRLADYLRAECIALHVLPHGGWDEETASTREAVERHMHFARNLRIDTHSIPDGDPSAAIANFARAQRITQIFMGRSLPRPWFQRFGETVVQRVVRLSPDTQITIVAERRR